MDNLPKRVGFIGAPGTGKSSLAWRLAERLQSHGGAELIPEFARWFISKHAIKGKPWTPPLQRIFFERQLEWESYVEASGRQWLVSESCLFLPYVYSLQFADPREVLDREIIQDLYQAILQRLDWYDYLVVLAPVLPAKEDNARVRGWEKYHAAILGFVEMHRPAWSSLGVSVLEPDVDFPCDVGEQDWPSLNAYRLEFILRRLADGDFSE